MDRCTACPPPKYLGELDACCKPAPITCVQLTASGRMIFGNSCTWAPYCTRWSIMSTRKLLSQVRRWCRAEGSGEGALKLPLQDEPLAGCVSARDDLLQFSI